MFPKKYKQQDVEPELQQKWYKDGIYEWNSEEPRENNFSIDTPPPTVSGHLHMGHIFSYTQTDFIARFQRMLGKNVFYPMGFDDNGLPTERLVEKVKKIRAKDVSRKEFVELCREVVDDAEKQYRDLFKSIAVSVDWKQEYQTVSPDSIKMSQLSFLDLFKKDLVKRLHSPTFWDPIDQTAIAQAEIEDKEKQGLMNNIKFTTTDGQEIVIATTRPELIPACVAVFYHPEDKRYTNLEGKKAITPIFAHEVNILPDSDVDMEKGTGLVMCCTFGDIQDIEWWRRHNLEIKQCVNLYGKMQHSGEYDNLKTTKAREAILEDLKAQGLVLEQTEVTQSVKCAERSGAILEIIPTHQWYISIMDHKEALLKKSEECNWFPNYMKIRLDNWIEGLNQDWCISRQRYFGVPFPVWYSKRNSEEGRVIVATAYQLPIDPMTTPPTGYDMNEVVPATDVMDTWATSSISPQLNSLSISDEFSINTDKHNKLFPFDLRPQAHEIIRTWSFYTIVKSYHHQNSLPWKNIALSGWCLAKDKTKMSKSKGNVITPQDIIDTHGADVVRYWTSTSKLGVDTAYSEDTLKIGKKLVNKLWNASKFAAIHMDKATETPITATEDIEKGYISETLDLWIISRLHKTIAQATASFEKFEYADARSHVEDFFWNDFCDNYLELVKTRAYDPEGKNPQGQISCAHTIHHCLKAILLLFAPFVPHVTEELNNIIFKDESIHRRGSWPQIDSYPTNEKAEQNGQDTLVLLELIRKYKSDNNLALNAPISRILYNGCDLSESCIIDLSSAAGTNNLLKENINNDDYISACNKYKIAPVI